MSDEEDVNLVLGLMKEIGKVWVFDGKKKGKLFRWNRFQKGIVECGWDSDVVFDLIECCILIELLRVKKKFKWVSDLKSVYECVCMSDVDKLKQIERVVGVLGFE